MPASIFPSGVFSKSEVSFLRNALRFLALNDNSGTGDLSDDNFDYLCASPPP
jgi:hypothetical protein